MSYILDALKKSEQQRSLGSLRKLSTPHAGGAQGERRVVLVLLVLLVALTAFLGAMAWWYREPLGVLLRGGSLPEAAPAVTAPAGDQAPSGAGVIDSTREVGPAGNNIEDAPISRGQGVDAQTGTTKNVETATVPTTDNDAAPASTAAREAVPVSDLPAELRRRLPPLAVSVVSWSGDAARRFVMIDGGIYKEGDRLPDGIRVDRIRRDRIELSMLSERFYIQPENLPRRP